MDMIAAKSAAMAEAGVPTDQWITFIGGWDPIQWDENPVGSGPGGGPAYVFPTLEQMDEAAGDYPFYLHLRANEAAYTNSPGMARLNELAAGTEGAGNPQIDPATGFVGASAVAFGLIKLDSDPREQAIRVMRGFNSVGLTAAVATGTVTRLTLEHSSPGQTEFDAIKSLGYEDVVGINLSSHAFYGRGAAGRVCDSGRFRTVVEQGLHAGIGTDSTNAQPSNPWINIYAMVTGKDVKGFGLRAGGVTSLRAIGTGGMGGMAAMGAMGADTIAGPASAVDPDAPITCPDERISRAQAVQLHTKGSAWLAGSEDDYGTLEEGKLADLVVLNNDIFSESVSDDEIQGIHSLMTIVDGKTVYVDEDAALSADVSE